MELVLEDNKIENLLKDTDIIDYKIEILLGFAERLTKDNEKLGFEKRPMDGYGAGMQWFWRGHSHA